jgi:peptidoglycan/xylan/chitin deacetylase (PgdA/CDA1 family)
MPRALILTALAALLLGSALSSAPPLTAGAATSGTAVPQLNALGTTAGPARPILPQLPDAPGPRSVSLSRGPAAPQVVHLSFDAGADRGYAEAILDTLKSEGVPASFGMTGQWAQANPDLVQRMVAEGHRLINHTWDHRSWTGLSDQRGHQTAAQIQATLDRTDSFLVDLTGQSTKPFVRPPYGDYDNPALAATYDAGYGYSVMWTVDSFGWRRIPATEIIARCLRLAEPGAIILMHVGVESRDGPALQSIITGLREQGYGFATLPGLFGQ